MYQKTKFRTSMTRSRKSIFSPKSVTSSNCHFRMWPQQKKPKTRIDAGEDILKIAAELKRRKADITFSGDQEQVSWMKRLVTRICLERRCSECACAGQLEHRVAQGRKDCRLHTSQRWMKSSHILKERLQLEKAQEEIQSVYDAVEDARAQQTKFEDIASQRPDFP